MSDVFKILDQVIATTSYAELYQVPLAAATTVDGVNVVPKAIFNQTQAIVGSIMVCNYTTSADSFNIRLRKYDFSASALETANDKQHLFKSVPIAGNSTRVLKLALTLSAGDIIEVSAASATTVSFTAMGIEVT